jgi:S1-C subfamily serine protease
MSPWQSERRRQIEQDLDPSGMIRRLAWDGSGPFTVEEWDTYVDWLVAQQEQESDEAPSRPAPAPHGAGVSDPTTRLTLGVAVKDGPGGALLGRVRPGPRAERAGFKPGDIIVAVDGTPVGTADALAQLLRASGARGSAALTVRRGHEMMGLRVPFGVAHS